MPSIPQSLLWISLVVLWLFVLVPMLINRRDTVRRTSDLALATRVLNGAAKSRLKKRSGPASGHRHDPDWQPADQFAEDYPEMYDETEVIDFSDQRDAVREYDDAVREARLGVRTRSVVVVAAVSEQSLVELDYLDVDVVDENSGALPVGVPGVQASLFDEPQAQAQAQVEPETVEPVVDSVAEPEVAPEPEAGPEVASEYESGATDEPAAVTDEAVPAAVPDGTADEYEYIDDTSGLEDAGLDDAGLEGGVGTPTVAPRSSNRQRRMANTTAAAVSARKYRFRKRVLMAMAGLMMLTAVLSFTVSPTLWWSCGTVAGVTVLYLAYLRRQTRIEEQVRRRRSQRMTRPRPTGLAYEDEYSARGPEVDFVEFPTRLQRPGAVVLDIDDEDPIFEHLDEVAFSRSHYGMPERTPRMSSGMPGDLPRAAGQ